jgi:hypothetical protein
MAVCPGGISVPAGTSCPPSCPPQVNPPGSGCAPVDTPPSATAPVTPVPDLGELLLDKPTVTGAEPLSARGAGCAPGTEVVLTTKGSDGLVEVVGRAVADSGGRFEAAVQFASLRAGYREVTANCGTLLVSGVDMVLTSSTGGTSMTYVLLVFFLLAGSLVVRFQMGEARRVRRR